MPNPLNEIMPNASRLTFTGDPNHRAAQSHKDAPEHPEPYIVSPKLKKAVNLALYLHRPLLLEGDAGCGKTRLASAVAYELGLPLYRWDVRSTSKAEEGLYKYDAILRLHDVQAQKLEAPIETLRDPRDPRSYVELGALGKAFEMRGQPAVVLIDEIDKADLDFPNDLLAVLDDPWEFKIRETGTTVTADRDNKPIVIITSNKEKGNLPAPFLRRCLYHYVEFPNSDAQLKEIVKRHYAIQDDPQAEPLPPNDLIQTAVEQFLAIWKEGNLFKKPGTSEFLDWLKALASFEDKPYSAKQLKKETEAKQPPYPELLFKHQQDWMKYAKA